MTDLLALFNIWLPRYFIVFFVGFEQLSHIPLKTLLPALNKMYRHSIFIHYQLTMQLILF